MDAFYAAIEQRDNPACRGKPVIVGADPKDGRGRGVVSACSYEARKFGVHSALPISTAYRRCPHAVYLPVDMSKYVRESKKVFEILGRFSPDIEPLSIDEAFIDITHSHHLFGTPEETCRKIKSVIKSETGLAASIGLAPNKHTAKIASDLEKPDGLVIIRRENLFSFLHALPVSRLWGVGEKTREAFGSLNIQTIGDLAGWDIKDIVQMFGKHGEHAWRLANGIDPREVLAETEAKSVGNEHTFEKDEKDRDRILDTLMALSENVSRRLRKSGVKGRTITLKIRFSDFKTFTRSESLSQATNFADEIYATASKKAKSFDFGPNHPIRLIGVSVSGLEKTDLQPGLFDHAPSETERKEKLHRALDEITERFGKDAIKRR